MFLNYVKEGNSGLEVTLVLL